MTRTRKALSWIAPLLVIGALSVLPQTARTAQWQDAVLLPGMVAAMLGWPEGAHSGAGASETSISILFIVIYVVSIAFWGGVIYLAQVAWLALRGSKS